MKHPLEQSPEEDFSSWQETIYLLRSPANARRLAEAVAEAEQGLTTPRELIEVDDTE